MLLNVLFPAAIMAIFNNLLFGIGEIFHSNVWWSRAFAMREGVGKKAYLLSGLFWFPVPIAAGFIALASGAFNVNVSSPDMVGPLVAARILGQTGAIVVFVVFFCSLASSIDSLLAATSDLITEDIYRKMIDPSATEEKLRRVSAWIIVGLGVLTWVVCLPRIGTLATVLFFAGAYGWEHDLADCDGTLLEAGQYGRRGVRHGARDCNWLDCLFSNWMVHRVVDWRGGFDGDGCHRNFGLARGVRLAQSR